MNLALASDRSSILRCLGGQSKGGNSCTWAKWGQFVVFLVLCLLAYEQRHLCANMATTEMRHFCLKHLKNEIHACKTSAENAAIDADHRDRKKRVFWKKGSFGKGFLIFLCPFSRDSREPPECGKQRRIPGAQSTP